MVLRWHPGLPYTNLGLGEGHGARQIAQERLTVVSISRPLLPRPFSTDPPFTSSLPPPHTASLRCPSPQPPAARPPPSSIMASPPLLPQIPAPTPLLGCISSPLALPRDPGYPGGPPASRARARAAGGAVGQPRASPPPRGDVTMPEPQSSWAGSAHSPVKTALIGRASAGRAWPVGVAPLRGRGSGCFRRGAEPPTGPVCPARLRPRHGEPGPAPARTQGPGLAPGGGARQLPPLIGRAPTALRCAESSPPPAPPRLPSEPGRD